MWQSVGLVLFNGTTLECFYSWVKSELSEERGAYGCHPVTFHWDALQLAVWSNTQHHTHTHARTQKGKAQSSTQNANPIFKAVDEPRTPTFASRRAPFLRRLIDCYCAAESTAVWVLKPAGRADTCCVSAAHNPRLFFPIQLEILMTISEPSVCGVPRFPQKCHPPRLNIYSPPPP